MEFKAQKILVCLFLTTPCVVSFFTTFPCPVNGEKWGEDKKDDETRCILRCKDGTVPSGCHVIRPLPGGKFNKPIPVCEKAPWLSNENLAVIGTGVAAVVGAPYALAAAGFTATGVVPGSFAAWLQGSGLVSTAMFGALQSAGAAGIATSAKVVIGTCGGGITWMSSYVMNTFKGCESE